MTKVNVFVPRETCCANYDFKSPMSMWASDESQSLPLLEARWSFRGSE